jgi:hypothetical protein
VTYFIAHLIWNLLCLKNIHSCQKSYLHKILSILYDSNGFKPYIFFCFSKLVQVPHTHTHIYWPYAKICGISIFGQFPKFSELPRQFSSDMSGLFLGHIRLARHVRLLARTCPGLRFPAYIRGQSAPLRTLSVFSLPHHHLRRPRAL